MRTLNLGILAHVDAGKTTLTERLLYAGGVIDRLGSVDEGSTQTDSLALERQRGITIRSAVASFAIDDLTVNLIDTPGHPDFIAEVERVLAVLDGAVLVVSAVEGVQGQTRVLMRTLQRLGIPTLLFVNKMDRRGARYDGVLAEIAAKLTPAAVPIGTADADSRASLIEALADHDELLLTAYVEDEASVTDALLREVLAEQTRRAVVHPVLSGSAVTGAGIDALTAAIRDLLPGAGSDDGGPPSGTVFKVERGPAGEKIAYVRMFSGTVRVRDRVRLGGAREGKVTAVSVLDHGRGGAAGSVPAGQIGKLWGLAEVQVGDPLGTARTDAATDTDVGSASGALPQFAAPTLETIVAPRRAADRTTLHTALTQLAEQDPLINLRRDEVRQELSVSLYGEVQKEVIQATLADDYGIDVLFRESTTLCVERPVGTGEAAEDMQEAANPFRATIGLRVEPAPPGSGIEFRMRVDPRTVPAHIYKNVTLFTAMMEQYVRDTLREGLFGWQVTDCLVTMTGCGYSVADGPPSRRGPDGTAADFRKLTPLVLMSALAKARTQVCEPVHRFGLDVSADALGTVLPTLTRLGATVQAPSVRGSSARLDGDIPAARLHDLQQRLTGLTRGEALIESGFDHYRPVRGRPPTRPRVQLKPLDCKGYLLHVLRRI